jgi:hypothetical protein
VERLIHENIRNNTVQHGRLLIGEIVETRFCQKRTGQQSSQISLDMKQQETNQQSMQDSHQNIYIFGEDYINLFFQD